jgi:hypothetical protein
MPCGLQLGALGLPFADAMVCVMRHRRTAARLHAAGSRVDECSASRATPAASTLGVLLLCQGSLH